MNDENPEVFSSSDPATEIDAAVQAASTVPDESAEPADAAAEEPPAGEANSRFKTEDAWMFADVLRQRWAWLATAALLFAGLGFAGGWFLWKPAFIASTRLVRNDSPRTAEVFRYQTIGLQMFVDFLKSPDLLARVSEQSMPPVPVDKLAKKLRLTPERDGDVVLVELPAGTRPDAVKLANLFADEAVRYTQQLQTNAANEVRQFIEPQLTQIDSEIAAMKSKDHSPVRPPTLEISSRPSPVQLKLNAAREELVNALLMYTTNHPAVQTARAKVESLEKQRADTPPETLPPTEAEIAGQLAAQRDGWEMLRSELAPLEGTRRGLLERKRAAELVMADPPGYYRIFSAATMRDVKGNGRIIKISALTVFTGFVGLICGVLLVLLVEVLDQRLKAPADLARVTGLRVVASAPDLKKLSPLEKRDWAFRTWTTLQGRLNAPSDRGLVCGITSARHGDGRSTWIKWLARAASESGFRVLTVTTRHEQAPGAAFDPPKENGHANGNNGHQLAARELNSLPSPMEVEHKLIGPHSQPVVHIPLPGWVWNRERRKQWQTALSQWEKIDNVVILVELPPGSMPEAVLLAEKLPNLLWLADGGSSRADETREQLDLLRDARCNLVGAVLNHASVNRTRKRFARWVAGAAILLSPGISRAQTDLAVDPDTNSPPVPAAMTNHFLEVEPPVKRAGWQDRFTLGPGDILRITVYGQPDTMRPEVMIGPDGRVGYLEVTGLAASGLTVDEFRSRLDDALGKFRNTPRTMVTPVAYRSKKYCVLGKVVQRGVYSLDHPVTVLEAVARARGFEIGLREHDSIDLVDLQRSFLMRGGKRLPVNFEKMFLDGDLAQNVAIEPGDYLFFPSASIQEIQVVGDVRYPGPVIYTPDISVIAAITQRAGFNEKAYRSRVLVIRGSFDNPETFVVDTKAILAGETPDFKLQPKDIVYVAKRPWYRAEELLDLAITAFLQSVVTSAVGQDVIKPINQ